MESLQIRAWSSRETPLSPRWHSCCGSHPSSSALAAAAMVVGNTWNRSRNRRRIQVSAVKTGTMVKRASRRSLT